MLGFICNAALCLADVPLVPPDIPSPNRIIDGEIPLTPEQLRRIHAAEKKHQKEKEAALRAKGEDRKHLRDTIRAALGPNKGTPILEEDAEIEMILLHH